MKIYHYLNKDICHIRHDHMPTYFMLKDNSYNIKYKSNVNPKWFDELSVKNIEYDESPDIFITDIVDSFVVNFIRSKKAKVFVFTDPCDGDRIGDFVLNNFDVILKYQCNKMYSGFTNVFVPPYPLSGGLIPDELKNPKPFDERDIDVFFLGGVYDESDVNNIRIRKVRELKKIFGDKFYGGITNPNLDVSHQSVGQNEFWNLLNRSKIALSINQREKQMGMDRRLSEIWLSGACPLTHPFGLIPHKQPKDQINILLTDNSLDNLCDKISDALNNINLLKQIAENGRNFFLDFYLNQGNWFYNILTEKMNR